jgi:hypothetical protein
MYLQNKKHLPDCRWKTSFCIHFLQDGFQTVHQFQQHMITKRKQCDLSDGHSLILEQTKHAFPLAQDSGICRTALRLPGIHAPEITAQCYKDFNQRLLSARQ